jgi:deoxyadenosine/deoxycytidine kinase
MKKSYNYISIEGNLGVGKTSLCHKIAEKDNCELILEQFADNPFLPLFYQNPSRYALTVELFFMTERYKQLQEHASQRNLFKEYLLSDYFFEKTALFANHNLLPEEYRLFQSLFVILRQSAPKPELLLFIDRPIEQSLINIKKRNRSYELSITQDYLSKVNNAYQEYLKSDLNFPRIILNAGDKDFLENESNFSSIHNLLSEKFPNKLININL